MSAEFVERLAVAKLAVEPFLVRTGSAGGQEVGLEQRKNDDTTCFVFCLAQGRRRYPLSLYLAGLGDANTTEAIT